MDDILATIPVERLVHLFRTSPAMHSESVKILKAHFNCPGFAATAGELAQLVGYKGHQATNLHYGIFASKLAMDLGDPRVVEACSDFWILFLATYQERKAQRLHGLFTLRKNTVLALQELGWEQAGKK